jgi:hypothetical protein
MNYMPILNDLNELIPKSLYLSDLDCYAVVTAAASSDPGAEILWQ